MNRVEFMEFFRDEEKLNDLTVADREEVFLGILLGSSDITKALLDKLCSDYEVALTITDNQLKLF